MRKILFILLFFSFQLSIFNSAWAQNESVSTGKKAIQEWVEEGNRLYRQGEYDVAIDHYRMAISSNYTSANLYYNLGNAYYRTGQMGLAILNYERALRLSPGMTDARQNLELANSKTTDRITVLPKLFLAQWYDSLITCISPSTWRIILFVLLVLLCASVVVIYLSRRVGLRKGALATGIVTLILLFVAVWLTIASTRHFNARSEAIVIDSSVAVKSSPESQSVDKLILHEGTKVSITETLSTWHKITLSDGTTGWCDTNSVERI